MAYLTASRPILVLLTLFLFVVTISAFYVKEFKLQPFECPSASCDRLVGFTQDSNTTQIYVFTKKTIKELDGDFSVQSERITSVQSDDNNVLMLIRSADLLLCKNDGTCEIRDLKDLNSSYTRGGMVPSGGGPTIGWIDKGPVDADVVNIAVSTSGVSDRTVPLVATRTLPSEMTSSTEFLNYLEDDFFVQSSFFQPSSCLVEEILPVYGFSAGSYRYILKLHKNESTSQVKIVRLCSKSSNYRSYIELPIQCDDGTGKFSDVDVVIQTAAYFTNGALYISFTRRSDDHPVTNVCAYDISEINDEFRQRREECLEGKTKSTELEWDRFNPCPSLPLSPSQFNFSRLDDDDFCYDLPIAQPLGGYKPISQVALNFLTINVVVNSIVVASSDDPSRDTVYLLGDKEGYVHRIIDGHEREVESVDPGHEIQMGSNGLQLSEDGDALIAMSDRRIISLPMAEPWVTTQPPTTSDRKSDDEKERSWQNWKTYTCIGAISLIVIIIIIISCIVYRKRRRNDDFKI